MDIEEAAGPPARESVAAAQNIVIAALALGSTYAAAGREADRSVRTVERWMSDAGFARRVSLARQEVVQQVTGQLHGLAVSAIETLDELMMAGSPPPVRLAAARAILANAQQYSRATDLETRLLELENAAGAIGVDEPAHRDSVAADERNIDEEEENQ